MAAFDSIRHRWVALAFPLTFACQTPASQLAESAPSGQEDNCGILVAVAQDSLNWGRDDGVSDWLTDISGYMPDCDWRAAGLPEPTNVRGRMMTFWEPRFGSEPDYATVLVSYMNHYGQRGLMCPVRREAGQWRGQSCVWMEDWIAEQIRSSVSRQRERDRR